MTERPPGCIAPNLSLVGLELIPRQLADGVYALMANQPAEGRQRGRDRRKLCATGFPQATSQRPQPAV